MVSFNFTIGFLVYLFAFQGSNLVLGKDKAILGNKGFKSFQSLLEIR